MSGRDGNAKVGRLDTRKELREAWSKLGSNDYALPTVTMEHSLVLNLIPLCQSLNLILWRI